MQLETSFPKLVNFQRKHSLQYCFKTMYNQQKETSKKIIEQTTF